MSSITLFKYEFFFPLGCFGCGKCHDVQHSEDSPKSCSKPSPQFRLSQRQQTEHQLQPGRHHPWQASLPQRPWSLHVRLHVRKRKSKIIKKEKASTNPTEWSRRTRACWCHELKLGLVTCRTNDRQSKKKFTHRQSCSILCLVFLAWRILKYKDFASDLRPTRLNCCIFRPAFGCCTLRMLFNICFFNIFCSNKL